MKRGTDHTWQMVRYNGDIAIYALCRCGFHYPASHSARNADGTWSAKQEINGCLYRYCPLCGARKKLRTQDILRLDDYP